MKSPEISPSSWDNRTINNLLFGVICISFVAVAFHAHQAAGLTLPVPWGDEAYFLWQARAFEHSYSFIAPELDPTRPVLLLPFVYQTTVGIIFKIFGHSLETARYFSFACLIAGFGFLAGTVKRHATPVGALLLISAVLLNKYFVVMGNVGRMESYFFAVLCGALLSLQRGKIWIGLGILSISPMIHPNGVFFLIPATLYALLTRQLRWKQFDRPAVIIFALSLIIWAANGLYTLSYWSGFVHDTAVRMGEVTNANGGMLSHVTKWDVVELGLMVIAGAVGMWRRNSVGNFLIFALGSWLVHRVRLEQWYEPFGDFSYLLLLLAAIELTVREVAKTDLGQLRWFRTGTATVLVIGLLGLLRINHLINGPFKYLRNMTAVGMRIEKDVPYLRADDLKNVRDYVKSVEPERPIMVEVYPWGEALLLSDILGDRVHYQVPFFDPYFQPLEWWGWGYKPVDAPTPDLYLIRVSRYRAQYLKAGDDQFLAIAMKRAGVENPTVIHSRDGTEVWYAIRRSPKLN